ncbi:MAG: ion channel [Bacteroidota bacterium]
MFKNIYVYRFEFLLSSQGTVLFGSLLVPKDLFETTLSPILFLANQLAGIILMSRKKKSIVVLTIKLAIIGVSASTAIFEVKKDKLFTFLNVIVSFLFYVLVTFEIIKQVWESKEVNKNVIFGLISGYISLGLVGFFVCLSIEIASPGSFEGLKATINEPRYFVERLMYYSYITLMTIGYGEIIPVTSLAQKAAILIGMLGQFYLVILTAVVVGKYVNKVNAN